MIIEKSVLSDVLKVLGKCSGESKLIRFVGCGGERFASATDGESRVTLYLEGGSDEVFDFVVPVKELRGLKGKTVELCGEHLEFDEVIVPDYASCISLPEGFTTVLNQVASVVDRSGSRAVLRGIHLSSEGATATDGKQLLHIPMTLDLPNAITISFPMALLIANRQDEGKLFLWDDCFEVVIGNVTWSGKILQGSYPNWKQAIPDEKKLDYSVKLLEVEEVLNFLKLVPDNHEVNGIELNVTPQGVSVIPTNFPQLECKTKAVFQGTRPRVVLTLNKPILLQMLKQGYHTFQAHSDGGSPIIGSGGNGIYVAMPVRIYPQINKVKETKMETENKIEVTPIEELNSNIEEFRNKLKTLLDESNFLIRKVKEVSLQQKQKEREFVQAKRAIERIKMAI